MDITLSNKSEFARLLRRMLDETDIFNRREWAEFLGVSQAAISQWLGDQTIPRPQLLRMIIDVVRSKDNSPLNLLEEFDAMAGKPSADVSPNGERIGDSFATYMIGPLLSNLLLDLKGLKPEVQERVLLRASLSCTEGRDLLDSQNESANENHRLYTIDPPEREFPLESAPRPEAILASIEQKVPGFLHRMTRYLTTQPNEAARQMARTFCLQAISLVRVQKNTSRFMLISKIIESRELEHSALDRIFTPQPLNALFLVDEEVAVLVKKDDGYVRVAGTTGDQLSAVVDALTNRDVRYVPVAKLPGSYKSVNAQEVKDAA